MEETPKSMVLYRLRTPINKLFEWIFYRMLASHRGGLGSIPGRDMSVLGPLVYDGDDKSLHSGDPNVIHNTQTCKYPILGAKNLLMLFG